MDPRSIERTGQLEPAVIQERAAAGNNTFHLKLIFQGVSAGWLGTNSSGWCVISETPTPITPYIWSDGKVYYKNLKGDWLSLSRNSYLGFYSSWSNATAWRKDRKRFISDYNGQALSLYSQDDGYLYAWDAYTLLDVEWEEQ
jgi:hypothetical protein